MSEIRRDPTLLAAIECAPVLFYIFRIPHRLKGLHARIKFRPDGRFNEFPISAQFVYRGGKCLASTTRGQCRGRRTALIVADRGTIRDVRHSECASADRDSDSVAASLGAAPKIGARARRKAAEKWLPGATACRGWHLPRERESRDSHYTCVERPPHESAPFRQPAPSSRTTTNYELPITSYEVGLAPAKCGGL
jgi:hypothetical protein